MTKTSGRKCLVYSMEAYQTNKQVLKTSEYKILNRIHTTRTFILLLFSPIWVPLYIVGWVGSGIRYLLKGSNQLLQKALDRIYRSDGRNEQQELKKK